MPTPLLLAGAFFLTTGGCITIPDPDPSELEGRWELTGALVEDDISDYVIEFDAEGEITEISYRYQNSARVIIDGSAIDSSSNVEDGDVSIVAEWFGGNSLFFEGAFNAAQDEIDGSVSYELKIGAITIEVPVGDAQLTRLD
jgi:hypothetical protein